MVYQKYNLKYSQRYEQRYNIIIYIYIFKNHALLFLLFDRMTEERNYIHMHVMNTIIHVHITNVYLLLQLTNYLDSCCRRDINSWPSLFPFFAHVVVFSTLGEVIGNPIARKNLWSLPLQEFWFQCPATIC